MDNIANAILSYNNMSEELADEYVDDLSITVTETVDAEAVINHILLGAYTEEGVKIWWDRARVQLDGHTPRQMLAIDVGRVVDLALSVLMQEAT